MSITSTIAISGLDAASLRLQVSATNVANAMSSGPLPDAPNAANYPAAYSAQTVVQTDVSGGGTSASIAPASPGTVASYDPTAPYADGNGMVASPNVDYVTEAVQQMMAGMAYAASASVLRSDTQMTSALLNVMV